MFSKLKVATIGNRGHAANVIDIINDTGIAEVNAIYKPNCTVDSDYTNNISDILASEAVFILSPNYSHFSYLDYLRENYSGYVFCEKPPVVTVKELSQLKNDPEKTYFNFNLRFSGLKDVIEHIYHNTFDEKIVKVNIMDCHGLAYKNIYKNSWRSDCNKHPLGVIETLAVHYLDLCNFMFGKIEHIYGQSSNSSGIGTANDTSELIIKYKENIIASIFTSYATPMMNKIEVVTSNSIYVITEQEVAKYYPRDTFDKQGRFITPEKTIENTPDIIGWESSLVKSINYFLTTVKSQTKLPPQYYNASLETNHALLSLDN